MEGVEKIVNGVTVKNWLGVPFAAAPEGNLRFKPVQSINDFVVDRFFDFTYTTYTTILLQPANPQPWSDVKRTNTSYLCPQIHLLSGDFVVRYSEPMSIHYFTLLTHACPG